MDAAFLEDMNAALGGAAARESAGRVELLPGETGVPFHMFSDAGKSMKDTVVCDALKGMEPNSTTLLFMSSRNVDAVQDGIRYLVYARSQGEHTIGRQSDTELIAIMRSVYLQHGRNTTLADGSPDLDEVKRLNCVVLDYCVSRILSEIGIYLRYKADISALPVPMERGEFSSSKGSRALTRQEF